MLVKNITQQSQKGWGKGLKEDTLKIYKYRDFTGSQVVKTAIVAHGVHALVYFPGGEEDPTC